MRRSIERMISVNGVEAELHTVKGIFSQRVMLQLIASKSWQNMERMVPTGGELLRGQYLLLCSCRIPIEAADTVVMGNRTFVIRRIEPIRYRNRELFYWGLCVEGGALEE